MSKNAALTGGMSVHRASTGAPAWAGGNGLAKTINPLFRGCTGYTELFNVRQQRYYAKEHVARRHLENSDIFKTYKPTSPGLRWVRRLRRDHLWKGGPIRELTKPKKRKGGRNNTGQITVRHRGGGHKRRLRLIDFMRNDPGPHQVVRLEYDPNRSADLALLRNIHSGLLSYIVAPEGLQPGAIVRSYREYFLYRKSDKSTV